MAQKIYIAPSLLAGDFGNLAREAQRCEEAKADRVHVDVMDGHFVPNITIGPATVKALRKSTKLPLEVHLMIERPDKFADAFMDAGSDTILVHVESPCDVMETLRKIQNRRLRCGVVLNPETPADAAFPFLNFVDEVLCMTVNPGFGGQPFLASVLDKIKILREKARRMNRNNLDIEVDGGINNETGAQCVAAGANVLAAGTAIFSRENLAEAINELREHAEAAKPSEPNA
jgi:ribulose-phosphate 3-epimerase